MISAPSEFLVRDAGEQLPSTYNWTPDDASFSQCTGEHMEFRLVYQGKITQDASPSQKHSIRKQFHPQLARLWRIHPTLVYMRKRLGIPTIQMAQESEPDIDEKTVDVPTSFMMMTFDAFADRFRVGDFRFVPLVADCFGSVCSLDILYLRRTTAGPLIDQQTGDLDNRIKILFDALRMPRPGDEMVGIKPAEQGENPFYCLVQDDSLITELRVTSDRLLVPSANVSHASNDVHMVITVNIKKNVSMPFTQMFE